ncbi:MAG: IPT/TIG domain-containing protein [Gemmatimonadaceae bacterium]
MTAVRFGQAVTSNLARGTRHLLNALMVAAFTTASACGGRDAVGPGAPLVANGTFMGAAVVGFALEQPVRFVVTDNDGMPRANVAVHWVPASDGRVSSVDAMTDANGVVETRWTLGTIAGMQTLRAQVQDATPQVFTANAIPDRAATVILGSTSAQIVILGDTARISSIAIDRYGNSVAVEPAYIVESGAEFIAIASPGSFVARARGTTRIRIQVDTAKTTFALAITPSTPVIKSVAPDTLVPGGAITITGSYFALAADLIDVTVGGVHPVITKVSDTRIDAVLPNASAFPCVATAAQPVRVTIAGNSGQQATPLRVANRITLGTGESANLLDIQQVRCTELVQPAIAQRAKYVLAVLNTSVTAATFSGFELRASGGGSLATQIASARSNSVGSLSAVGSGPQSNALYKQAIAEEQGHAEFLDRQRQTVSQYGSPAASWNQLRASRRNVAAARTPRAVGDTLTMKAIYSSCSVGRDVRARVVFIGSKAIMLEDISSPRAGQMDAQYRAMGQEFDAIQYPLLTANMGDPLAMDATLGGDGKVTMLFTRYVNDSLPGIQGYATACNFYPKTTFAPSNEDEVFYARVAALSEDPEAWRRTMRSTVLHETKHLASFAERMSRNVAFEESWLEESTARIAEELYSRTFDGGGSWKGNSGYVNTVRCEIYQCDDRPLMMWKHFSVLHQFFRGVDTLTPIGAAASGDFTFYASGWSLVRWAADHYAVDEASWLRDLVKGGSVTGLANLALRTGHSVDEMLADWSLANAVDDQPAFKAQRAELSFPSWNMPDIMNGLAVADPVRFGDVTPLRIRAFTFGGVSLPVPKLRAFSSSYFSFEGIQNGSQVLELRGENGGALPASLRVAIVRVE